MKNLSLSVAVLTSVLLSQAMAQTTNINAGDLPSVDVRQVGSTRVENVPAIPDVTCSERFERLCDFHRQSR